MKVSATLEIGIDSLPNESMDVQVEAGAAQPTDARLACRDSRRRCSSDWAVGVWGKNNNSKRSRNGRGFPSRFCKTLASGNGVRATRILRLPTPRLPLFSFGLPDRLDGARAAV